MHNGFWSTVSSLLVPRPHEATVVPVPTGLAIYQLLRRHTSTTQTPGVSLGGVQLLLGIKIPEVVKKFLKKGDTLLQWISASNASLIVWHLDVFGWAAWRVCCSREFLPGRARRHAIELCCRRGWYDEQEEQSSEDHDPDRAQRPRRGAGREQRIELTSNSTEYLRKQDRSVCSRHRPPATRHEHRHLFRRTSLPTNTIPSSPESQDTPAT